MAIDPDPALIERFRRDFTAARPARARDTAIGLAVSGGPDSLALLLLAHAAFPDRVRAATVDHGLRPESAAEADMVARVCADLGVPHAVLRAPWKPDAREGLQAAARGFRYARLEEWCLAHDLGLLATAHHADDQAETLLMRIARGAGIGGLGSIRVTRLLSYDIWLVRPLLRFAKAELIDLVAKAGLNPVADPSNRDERFDRTHARALLADTEWLRSERLAATAANLADADVALSWAADRELAARLRDEAGSYSFDPQGIPDEIVRRMVAALIALVDARSTASPYTGPELTRFIAALREGRGATLAHVRAKGGACWRFAPAPPRRDTRAAPDEKAG